MQGRKATKRDPNAWTDIAVRVKTRDELLNKIAVFGETRDDTIRRVCEFYIENKDKVEGNEAVKPSEPSPSRGETAIPGIA